MDLFDPYAGNSLHGNVTGLAVSALWDPDPLNDQTGQYSAPRVGAGPIAAVAAGLFGEVFRDDAVSGTAGVGFEVVGNLLFAPPQVATEVLLPVFDGCTVAGAQFAFAFGASEPRSGTTNDFDPGIAAVTLADCLATGPGTAGSAAAGATAESGVSAGADADLFGATANDRWQGFVLPAPGQQRQG